MEHEYTIYEVLGVTKFMIFLSKRLNDREYRRVRDLQTEYLDEQLDVHVQQSETLAS